MSIKKIFLSFCLIATLLTTMAANIITSKAYASEQKTICIVHSYNENSPWVIDFSSAIEDDLASNKDLIIKNYYLETDTIFTDDQKLNYSTEIKENIEKDNPYLLICSDEDAFHYVARNFFDTDIYVIVSGLNGDPIDYDLVYNNVFAVFEQESITASIEF
ncbi:MAG: hypothetical protein PHQ52_08305, partial [Candidatus Omnitrophica bacterium]|nr:hypothetical protein [Candidatus Omnitrophota bacterium]